MLYVITSFLLFVGHGDHWCHRKCVLPIRHSRRRTLRHVRRHRVVHEDDRPGKRRRGHLDQRRRHLQCCQGRPEAEHAGILY